MAMFMVMSVKRGHVNVHGYGHEDANFIGLSWFPDDNLICLAATQVSQHKLTFFDPIC